MVRAFLAALVLAHVADDLDALKKKFDEEKSKPFAQRTQTIGKIGALKTDEAADFLIQAFETDKDESARSYLLSCLGTCGTDKAVAKLLSIAKDKNAAINHRSSALSALGRSKNPEVFDLIVSIVKDRDNTLRTSAASSLQQYPLKDTESIWRELLVDPNPTIVGYALRALAPLKDAKVLDIAKKIITDPKETAYVKGAAVDCWKAVGNAEMVKVLLAAASGAESTLINTIIAAIAAVKDADAVTAVLDGLKHAEPAVRSLAARIVAKLKPANAYDAVEKLLDDKDASVKEAALEAIAVLKDPKSEETLRKFAEKGDEDAVRLLGTYPSKETIALLAKLAEKPKSGVTAIDALAAIATPEVLPALLKALKHKEWPHRAAAVKGLGRLKMKEAVDALIDQLGKEDGRLEADIIGALQKLTNNSLGPNAKSWKEWWKAQREAFVFPEKSGAGGVAGGSTYCGIPVTSKRIIFCLDISGSMSAMSGTENRLEQAKKELSRAVKALDKGTMINFIFFDNRQEAWQKQLVDIKKNLDAALKHIGEQKPRGGTNIYDTLELAFQDPNVDTIFLLSDGAPGSGKFVNTEDILREIKKLNATRQIAIHTISLGASDFMKKLAEQNSGQYVEIK